MITPTIYKSAICFFLLIICFTFHSKAQTGVKYDIVLTSGRVIDPETNLDTVKNIGILDHTIARISSEPLDGKEVINVTGLVVAPGFIDMHVHGRTNKEQEYQLHDGITTALELEWGIAFLDKWYEFRQGKALINYGASVCWPFERFKAIEKYKAGVNSLYLATIGGDSQFETLFNAINPASTESVTQEEMNKTLDNIKNSLSQGGIGIGIPIGYLKKSKPEEMFEVFKLAGELKALVFTHVREPNIISIQEVITDAMLTGAPLHIVHLNSVAFGHIQFALDMIQSANRKGIDITTELYPYAASSTTLQSPIFSEGWQEIQGISYGDLEWVATGERLTKETFEKYRKIGGVVINYNMKPEWIKAGISAPGVMIASDGMPYAPKAHPRTAGTFSRVLGKYVREEKVIDLNTAIEKMTLLPARRLEGIAPMMRLKGRIQAGADADITIFNPKTIIDKATFENGLEFSAGIEYVIVNGIFILKNGKTVAGIYPGQAVFGKYKK